MANCKECGVKVGFMADYCNECIEKKNKRVIEKRAKNWGDKKEERDDSYLSLPVTTAHNLEGQRVIKNVDIVTAECVFGMNIFRDIFAGVRDIFGGRSEASQKVLRDARVTCLNELRREAYALGGNAVIAVDLDYSEFSGGGKSMLFLVASGTAVVVNDEAKELSSHEGAL